MAKLQINVDGGSRGNPGEAAVAVVVRDSDGRVLEERGERIGKTTNNVAEYRAMLLGIERAVALGASELELVGDSELVVRQIKGEYKVKEATLRELHAQVSRALEAFERWSVRHVRRERNEDADRLVNEVLDRSEDVAIGGEAPPTGAQSNSSSAPSPGPEPVGPVAEGALDPRVDIGHVHLKVADIDRALGFYCDVLGFELQQRMGEEAAFVSAGGYHHHIGLNTWHSKGGSPPPATSTGLFHLAIRYPTRRSLADALRRLSEAGITLSGASDHGVSEALYLADPDGNGIELYWDRPRDQWPRGSEGEVEMSTSPLNLQGLLAELDG